MSFLWSFTIVLLSLTLATVYGSQFHYPDLIKNEEFPEWGGICDGGKAQSPINLNVKGSKYVSFKPLKFVNYDKRQSVTYVVNNGHTVMLNGFTTPMEVSSGPLSGKYQVEQIHFHWDSEHTINNERYPLEIHIVHRNKQYLSLKEAVSIPNGVLVIGILFHYNNKESNSEIAEVLSAIDEIHESSRIDKPTKLNSTITVSGLFPTFDNYFTYNGSLTTPNCDETVTWIVSVKTFPITSEQVKTFKEIQTTTGEKLVNNYRFLQKLNQRKVLISDIRDNSEASLQTPMLTLLLLSFMILFLK